jgi:uncharacterized surface protein with fasciclin (FAS1) repeats
VSISSAQLTTLAKCLFGFRINNHGVVKTFTVRYKCCYGFMRTKGTSGCEKQLELKPLLDTINDLDAKVFRNLVQSTGLEDTFKNGNYTVFVPTDVALNEFNEKMTELVGNRATIAERGSAVFAIAE